MNSFQERIAGGLWGLIVGDAVGVPFEFHTPEQLPPREQLDMIPPSSFARSYKHIPHGTWSDDGAQALALLQSLQTCNGFEEEHFAHELVRWYLHGNFAVEREVFDVGIQTSSALQAIVAGVPVAKAARADEQSNGNGSLMRVLPLALWHKGSNEELVSLAHAQSHGTHAHIRSKVCCALYCLWARNILYGMVDVQRAWSNAVQTLQSMYGEESSAFQELEQHIQPHKEPHGRGTGYVVDSLHSARLALQESNYESVIKAAIALGNDTDTTACIAGGIAGIRDGLNAIPARWMQLLRGKEIVEPLLGRLLKQYE